MIQYVIDTQKLRKNTAILQSTMDGVPVIGVVKCNGYGMGLVPASRILVEQGVSMLAVLLFEEAATLREAGIDVPILMLTPAVTPEEADAVLRHRLIACVDSADSAAVLERAACAAGSTVPVHLMMDTGFGRYGFLPGQEEDILRLRTDAPHLRVEGCFSHLQNSFAANDSGVRAQVDSFLAMTDKLTAAGMAVGMRHIANTAAALRYPYARLDAVRVGSGFSGLLAVGNPWGVEPVGHLECAVTAVKWVPKGQNIGYGDMFHTKRPTRIAIVPAGHIDGYGMTEVRDSFRFRDHLRYLWNDLKAMRRDNRVFVDIAGQKAPLLGRFTLTNVIVDVTDISCRPGDIVCIDKDPLSVSPAVPRVYR